VAEIASITPEMRALASTNILRRTFLLNRSNEARRGFALITEGASNRWLPAPKSNIDGTLAKAPSFTLVALAYKRRTRFGKIAKTRGTSCRYNVRRLS
jgi:hypothetical protein